MNQQKLTSVYILDDNENAIEILKLLLEKNYSVDILGTQTDPDRAMEELTELDPDLLFLDIELPNMTGLEFCSLIRPRMSPKTKIVFYTGHDKYLLEAIRRDAFDYLLKPPTEQELSKIMMRYYENKLAGFTQASSRSEERLPIILVVNPWGEHLTLREHDCLFFRYNPERKFWEVTCNDGKTYTLRHRTTADTILNYSADFVQIHKRYIVNINHIKMIQESFCVLNDLNTDPHELKVSKNYRRSLFDAFYSL